MNPVKIRRYLDEHPHVYERFEREALRMWDRGFNHYSARTIIEYLRHQTALEADPEDTWKINNDIAPTLARDFLERHPEIPPKFFEKRTARTVPSESDFKLVG